MWWFHVVVSCGGFMLAFSELARCSSLASGVARSCRREKVSLVRVRVRVRARVRVRVRVRVLVRAVVGQGVEQPLLQVGRHEDGFHVRELAEHRALVDELACDETRGAPDQQCTWWEGHGVGVHCVRGRRACSRGGSGSTR